METKMLNKTPPFDLAIYLLLNSFVYFAITVYGYIIDPFNHYVINCFSATFIVWATVRGLGSKYNNKKEAIVYSALLPLIAFFYIIVKVTAVDTSGSKAFPNVLQCFITLICSMIIFFSYEHKKGLKIGLGTIYLIISISISFLLFLLIIFADPGMKTVVKSEVSPNSVFIAEVIDNNQGLLGGSTMVTVTRKNCNINLVIVELRKKPSTIYVGTWGESDAMALRWDTDGMLYINDDCYAIQ